MYLGCRGSDGGVECVFYLLFHNSSHGIYGILVNNKQWL